MRFPHTYLFVPGNRPERFAKAHASGAQAVILDLEDAVPPDAKVMARQAIVAALDATRPVYVRINGASTQWFAEDIAALAAHDGVAGILLPKAESAAQIDAVVQRAHPALSVLPVIETARGFAHVDELCGAPRVQRMVFGTLDFQVDLGIEADEADEWELLPFRAGLVLASRLAGLPAPVDGISTVIDDAAAIEAAARRGRRAGFGGKLCIHPRQIDAVHRAYACTDAQRAWAARVLAAVARGEGVAVVDGRMVDAPVIARATRIMESAQE
jgi:citrate lyase subunit beta/citryl-CoA lyase